MRVLQLTNMWPRPDVPARGIFCKRQVDGVRDTGVDVDVWAIEGDRSRWNYLRGAFRVMALNLRGSRYDVIHAHTGHCGVLGVLQLRSPVVVSFVGYDLDVPAEDWENWRTRTERVIFRYLSLLVAVPIAKSERGRRHLPLFGRKRAVVVPNGIDRELFVPMPRSEARRRLGWDPTRRVVLFAADDPSRFTKNFPLAEQAVELARHSFPDVELRVAASVLPDEVPVWMNAADVLVLSSVAEGSPNVVKEAMACNLPIVAVDVGDVREVVEGTRYCTVCAPDPRELAAGLVAALSAVPERSDGRERTEHLGLDEISGALVQIYACVAARGPGPLGFCSVPWRRSRPCLPVGPHTDRRSGAPQQSGSTVAVRDQ
jgi:teichuronic acid biosynthesis glycosyltransferase TuaC